MNEYKEIEHNDNPYSNTYECPYGHTIGEYDYINEECSECETEHYHYCEEQ